MIPQFETLTKEEATQMFEAIPLITILIAGADDNIDYHEKKWATKLAKIRTYSNPDVLHEFYSFVGINFSEKLNSYIDQLSKETSIRQDDISNRLTILNDIFPKIDPHFGAQLYSSFLSFANHVANASGGFLGFGRVSSAEQDWIDLPMLIPVIAPEEMVNEEEE